MGSPKALLADPGGVPFIVRICDTLITAGLGRIVVVTGPDHEQIGDVMSGHAQGHVTLVRNPAPDRGQLSSLHVGMTASLSDDAEGLLMTLVDVPMVTRQTVRAVVEAWELSRAAIVRPVVGEQHGHPVIFDRRLFGELREAPLDRGAKHVIRAHAADIENVSVADRGCLVDVDTPEDYERVIGRDRAGWGRIG